MSASYISGICVAKALFNSDGKKTINALNEKMQLLYDYYKNHSIIIGKIHTPVNYWNDVYHHGRVFFPSIDRPTSFSYLVPLHNLGIQFQGQNLGKWNF